MLATLTFPGATVELRRAVADDLPTLVALLADDDLGAGREGEDLSPYGTAFAAIDADPAQLLVVAESDGTVVGMLQLSVIPGLGRRGALRGQIEAVRVARDHRGGGLGAAMLRWTIEEARRRGCTLVQLTTDKRRTAAHWFYERLGFVATHEGMKVEL